MEKQEQQNERIERETCPKKEKFFCRFSAAFSESSRFMRIFNRWVWIIPPVIVAVAMLIWFSARDLYPFSDKSIAWSDMVQQYIPLLASFKDIMAGKDGFFFNVSNGAGMNFYGVFFYYLASPFTFLVTFVDKTDIWGFVNIIILLKMCVMSGTASFYLSRKNPNAPLLNIFLSVLYAYSGYAMMYFLIPAWLDVMYLFPLLLLGLDRVKEGKRGLFIFALASSIIVNFYLGYMLVIFLLLYGFVYVLMTKNKKFAGNFVLCCVVAMLVSAVAWLPSLLQYFSSGRKTSIIESLSKTQPFVSYQTSWQTVLSMLFLFPFAFCHRDSEDKDGKLRQILFFAMLVPMLFIEPINKMWHTGDYMCFPTRYGFMPLFLCITLTMDKLSVKMPSKEQGEGVESFAPLGGKWLSFIKKDGKRYAVGVLVLLVSIAYCFLAIRYTNANVQLMDQYSSNNWGNDESIRALLKLYSVALLVGVALFVVYRWGMAKRCLLWLSIGAFVISELYVAPMTYMSHPGAQTSRMERYQGAIEIANVIDDDSFYRVKAEKEETDGEKNKLFDVMLLSAGGLNGLGHFTSLTNGNYMYAMKQFGYSSYWTEVDNYGGTAITDALLSVKYKVSNKKTSEDLYQGKKYHVSSTPVGLSLGIIARRDIIQNAENLDYSDRGNMQEILYEDFFGENDCVTNYTLKDAVLSGVRVAENSDGIHLTPGTVTFKIPVTQAERLYLNIFDKNDNTLHQSINKDFDVSVPSSGFVWSQFPQQTCNGLLELGEFENRAVEVKITVRANTTVQNFGIVGVKEEPLLQAAQSVKTVDMRVDNSRIYGSYNAEGGESVFLSVPYDTGFRLKINGKKASYYQVYDGFIGFYLQEGENHIELSYLSPGFPVAVFLTVCGTGLCAAAFVLWKRKKIRVEMPPVLDKIAYYGLLIAGVAVIAAVYVMPLLLVI